MRLFQFLFEYISMKRYTKDSAIFYIHNNIVKRG